MSLEQLGSKSYALRNFWEATLFDEKQNPMDWTTGLMLSTNIPKLKFIVESILAGSSKGYRGWELPDSLNLTMRETSDHALERYLDEWMTGNTGVFNPETGAFRVQDSPDFLYRKVRVRTFYYKFTSNKSLSEEATTAIVTYTCAIESYDIGSYDYSDGGAVQYTISLPVCDVKVEHDF
jgi:hypothetical protein